MNDAEMARRLRFSLPSEFVKLATLLGDDVKAARALREESEFVCARPGLPRGSEFAAKVRGWLISNKLPWSQENLGKAADAVQSATA